MEKLEKKIESTMIDNLKLESYYKNGQDYIQGIDVLSIEDASKSIASEVKDIAIAFAEWKEKLPSSKKRTVRVKGAIIHYDKIPDDDLFTSFLTTYYKK